MGSKENAASAAERKYVAFISYRHKPYDMAVAKRTHALIERYSVPRALRERRGKRLGIAFRDQDELPVSGDLTADICRALDHSEFLIVICTPNTPESIWVQREIEYFLKGHDRSHVLAVLASGDPDRSFPRQLTHLGDENDTVVEPLAANICADTEAQSLKLLSGESVRLFAAILGCPYDSLVRREQKRKQKRAFAVAGVALAVLVGYMAILLRSNRAIEAKNQELEAANVEIAAVNRELETANGELEAMNGALEAVNRDLETANGELEAANQSLTEQKRALQLSESSFLTANAEAAIASGNTMQAIANSVAALPRPGDDRPYYAPAEGALLTAYHFFDADNASIFIGEKAIDLHAPVKQVFTTERAVILLDEYGNVSSYQAATAALNWEASLPFITSSSGSLGNARKEALIVPDPDHALIYALFADEIIALDAETGETVWQSGGEHRFDQLTINSADSTLICLEDTVQHLADPELLLKKVYDVVVLDALTGAEKQRCSLNESFERGEPYINSSARDKENHNTALNPNGTLFAGVIYHTEQTEGNIQQYATYYTVDLKKNESRVLYSEKIDSGILWMAVEKSGNKQILSLIRPLKNTKDGLSMKRIDLTAGSVQYDLEALPNDSSFSIQSTQHFSVVEWINGVLLLCADDHFYIVYPQSGEILMQGATEKPVINAWLIDDIYFGFVFDDGSYEICWPGNDEMAHSGKLGQKGSLPLGEITGAYPAGVGFLFPTVADDRIQGCKLDDSIFIAVTDAANSRRVLIKQPAFIDKSAYDTALPINVTAPASPFADGTSVMINRDGAVTLAARDWNASVYTWYRYAPQTNALETYEYPFEKTVVSAWLLPKSNQLLLHPTEGSVACYDFSTGKTTELGAEKKVVVATGELFGQATNFWGTLSKAKSIWSSADDRVWTAFCDNKQISIWADGELMQTVALSEGFPWAISHGTHIESIFEIGENGYLLLSNYSSELSLHIGQFALYNIRENAWTLVEDDAQGDANRTFALAESQDLFAVLEPDRVLRIYDISEQRAIQAVKVPIDMESVSDCRFVGGDGYFAFCTKDGLVEIYAVESGDCVFSGPLPETTFECGRISAHLDEKNGRLYLIEHKNHVGFCFDFSSCTKIGDMTNVYGCDPQTGSLCYYQYGSGLFLRRIPSTEEMVRLGQGLLN